MDSFEVQRPLFSLFTQVAVQSLRLSEASFSARSASISEPTSGSAPERLERPQLLELLERTKATSPVVYSYFVSGERCITERLALRLTICERLVVQAVRGVFQRSGLGNFRESLISCVLEIEART